MSYYETKLDSLRLSAREQAGLRRAQKGLGDRTRLFKDEEADPNKLVTTRGLIPSRDRKEETSQPDFLTEFYNELLVSNQSLAEQIEEYIRKNESESTQKEPKLNLTEEDPETTSFNTGTRLKIELEEVFGLEDFQAAAIVGNLDQETGGFKFMQELDPAVKGSKGGYGFAQWTGPRRKAFEAWASQNNLDISSYDANFGFLVHEIQNNDYFIKVMEKLSKTKNIDEATEVFSEGYLKPGIPKMNLRKKKSRLYLGK
tara:strand:+ start:2807 stop:3577 length:771 start_codon:yes stop_codon:yes gene_type:complete